MTLRTIGTVLLILILISLLACRSLNNGGSQDFVQVQITIEQPENNSANRSYSASSVQTAAVFAVADSFTIDTMDQVKNWYDGQLQNLVDGTVTLTVPLNTTLKLAKWAYSEPYTLEQIINGDDEPSAYGISDAFTVTGADETKTITINYGGIWKFVDGDGTAGINYDSIKSGSSSVLAVYNSGLYAAWSEATAVSGGDNYGNVRVGLWDGVSAFPSGPGENGLNKDETQLAEHLSMVADSTNLYLAWGEYENGGSNKRQLRMKKLTGSTWTWLDGNLATGLNVDTAEDMRMPSMVIFNNELLMAWEEKPSSIRQIYVFKKDLSSATKTAVYTGGATGINKAGIVSTGCDFCSPKLVEFNAKLYAMWIEEDAGNIKQVRMAEWNGGAGWTFKDGDAATGLNYDTGKNTEGVFPVVYNSKLYATWFETNGPAVDQVRVIEWDGTTWRFVDGNGADGINFNTAKNVFLPSLVVHNSKLYAVWTELNASNIYQARMAKWDGNSTWTFVDGNGADGLNKDTTIDAYNPTGVVYNSKLFLTWYEGDLFGSPPNPPTQVRVLQTGL
jgi:hypothetical protein